MRLDPGLPSVWVSLVDRAPGPTVYDPARVKVHVASIGPGTESRYGWQVNVRYHPQISEETVLILDDGRRLWVRGIENAGNLDRSSWIRLTCDEVP